MKQKRLSNPDVFLTHAHTYMYTHRFVPAEMILPTM